MIDLLSAANIANEIIQRTSSTPDTLQAVQLSLAPAFLLVGIGSVMNVMVTRLNWIAGRIERLSEQEESSKSAKIDQEMAWLAKRRKLSRRAIVLATAAAVTISIVIAVLFCSVYIEARIGTLVAFLWVITMGLLISALSHFLLETRQASLGPDTKPARWV